MSVQRRCVTDFGYVIVWTRQTVAQWVDTPRLLHCRHIPNKDIKSIQADFTGAEAFGLNGPLYYGAAWNHSLLSFVGTFCVCSFATMWLLDDCLARLSPTLCWGHTHCRCTMLSYVVYMCSYCVTCGTQVDKHTLFSSKYLYEGFWTVWFLWIDPLFTGRIWWLWTRPASPAGLHQSADLRPQSKQRDGGENSRAPQVPQVRTDRSTQEVVFGRMCELNLLKYVDLFSSTWNPCN